jgi:8-amino-7-oxononanoate synthase
MGLFDRHAGLLEAYRDVRTTGYDPFQIRMERVLSPTEAIINGRKTLLVGTNNYFGLTFDPSCRHRGDPRRGHRHDRLAHRQRQL